MVVGKENTGPALRRSTRVQAEISMRVRSLDPGFSFDSECKTLLVNAHGCGFQSTAQIPVGIALLFSIKDRQATATVLNATSLGENSGLWVVGAKLHQSGNFWGLPSPPADWVTPAAAVAASPGANEDNLASRVTAEVQRQSEQVMASLRSEVEKIVDARETELLGRIVQQSALTSRELVRRVAEEESNRLRQAFEELASRFRAELEEFAARQTTAAETRLRELHVQLAASGQAHFERVAAEVVQKMNGDAKRLSDSAVAQWQAVFEQALAKLPELVRENLHRVAADATPAH